VSFVLVALHATHPNSFRHATARSAAQHKVVARCGTAFKIQKTNISNNTRTHDKKMGVEIFCHLYSVLVPTFSARKARTSSPSLFFAISLVSRHCITKHTPVTKMVAVHLQTGASKQMAATRLLREKVERAMGGGGCKRTVHVLHASLGMSSLWPQRQYSWGINLVRSIPPQNIFTYQQIKIMETVLQRALVLL
jgi:hypothetical protein